MTIRTHTHHTTDGACTITMAHPHRTGYTTARGADRYVTTTTAPDGRTYVTVPTDAYNDGVRVSTYDVWCTPTPGYVAPLATRDGVAITTIDPATSYVETADGMGYAAPSAPVAAPTAPVCTSCGMPAVALDTVPVGAHITLHMHGGDGSGRFAERTYAGTVAHDVINAGTDDAWTMVRVDLDGGGSWTTPRSDYIVHVDAPVDAPADDAPVDAPTGMVHGVTYTGTVDNRTDYTVTTNGTVTTRTYTSTDGWTARTYADANHMWTSPDAFGDVVTYVVAEGTYYRTFNLPNDSVRVSAVAWRTAGGRACGHSFGAYGACVAPYGHPHTDHIDANGHHFTGPAMARYAGTYGPVAPDTYVAANTPRGDGWRAPGAHARTVLRDDVWRFVAMVYAVTTTADMDMYDGATDRETYDTYRHVVDYILWTGDGIDTPHATAIATVAAIDAATYLDIVYAVTGIARP